jgi:hypothetical protein
MSVPSVRAGRFREGDFRIGHVLSRTALVFSRNFLKYFAVTAVASLPPLLVGFVVPTSPTTIANPFQNFRVAAFTVLLTIVLSLLSQAIVLYGAFQDMRERPVRLADCLKVGLGRAFPIIGLAICAAIVTIVYVLFMALAFSQLLKFLSPALGLLAFLLLLVPLPILYLMWFVATPACVVERLGPIRSMGRSRALTKGHRWKIFGLILVIVIPALIVSAVIVVVMARLGLGSTLQIGAFVDLRAAHVTWAQVFSLIWTAIWTAFFAILGVVSYHDLRVAKEGVDTEQIAAVFE